MEETSNFSDITNAHIERLKLSDRKKLGQYMTPQSIASLMVKKLSFQPRKHYRILDPAVGTGELLRAVKNHNDSLPDSDKPSITLEGWDIDAGMLKTFNLNLPSAVSLKQSIYETIPDDRVGFYDKIIANPPYFQVSKKTLTAENVKLETAVSSGRVNIYGLFFEYALNLLKPGGELVFLIPPSMNNGAYFSEIRKHIMKRGEIKSIQLLRDNKLFSDALTSAQIVHIVKLKRENIDSSNLNSKHIFDFNTVNKSNINLPTIFTEDSSQLKAMWEGKKSLNDAGYTVRTGSLEWNQHRDLYSNNGVPLLHSKDIGEDNQLVFNPKLLDRRFLPETLRKPETRPAIIVNRIVGSLSAPKLKYCLVDLDRYYTENHINVITVTEPGTREEELEKLNLLIRKLKSNIESQTQYLKLLTGNTQLSATELQYMIPV